MSLEVLYFSAVTDHRNALVDATIASELLRLEPALNITFASCDLGAAALRHLGFRVSDLDVYKNSGIWEWWICGHSLLSESRPTLVISHGEFHVLPLAKASHVPVIFLADWIGNLSDPFTQCLQYANEVIVLDEPGHLDVPPFLRGKTSFAGAVLQKAVPNAGSSLSGAPIASQRGPLAIVFVSHGLDPCKDGQFDAVSLVLEAFEAINIEAKHLFWVVGEAELELTDCGIQDRRNVSQVKWGAYSISNLQFADLLITACNSERLGEFAGLGIPSISLSCGQNPIEEWRVARIPGNTALRVGGLSANALRDHMLRLLNTRTAKTVNALNLPSGDIVAAQKLRPHLRDASGSRTRANHRIILLSGVPGSGKSTFGRWLARNKGFIHLDVEMPGVLQQSDLRAAWWHMVFEPYGSAMPLYDAIRRFGAPVAIDWGFPVRLRGVVEALQNLGVELFWFDGDRDAARRSFINRGTVPIDRLDAQMLGIESEWPSILALFGDKIICNIDSRGEFVEPNLLYSRILAD